MAEKYSTGLLKEMLAGAPFLQSVFINNPSNASYAIDNYVSVPVDAESFQKLSINVPVGVTYQPVLGDPKNPSSKVLSVIGSFDNFTSGQSFWVNMTYWQKIDLTKEVTLHTFDIVVKDFGNGTWMETHTLEIENNSNNTIRIPTLDYDWFMRDYVIRNSTIVYLNGNIQPYNELIAENRLSIEGFALAQKTTNLTFTFLDTQNPSW